MRRFTLCCVIVMAGCSTAPVADVLDRVRPGRIEPETKVAYGGVDPPRPLYGLATPDHSMASPAPGTAPSPDAPAQASSFREATRPATLPPAPGMLPN